MKHFAFIISVLLVFTLLATGCAQSEDSSGITPADTQSAAEEQSEEVVPAELDNSVSGESESIDEGAQSEENSESAPADTQSAAEEAVPVKSDSAVTVESAYIDSDGSGDPSYALALTAKDEAGKVVWQYTTPFCKESAECDTAQYLGTYGALVLVNEQGLVDGGNGGLRALNAADGSTAWINSDYTGVGACTLYDEETGVIYVSGFYGPACMAIDSNGKTVWKVDQTRPGRHGAYEMSFDEVFGGIPCITIKFTYDDTVDDATSCIYLDGNVVTDD